MCGVLEFKWAHRMLTIRPKIIGFFHLNRNETSILFIVSFIVRHFFDWFKFNFSSHWVFSLILRISVARSLSQSAWNIFAISPQVCRCVVALCLKTYTQSYAPTHDVCYAVSLYACMGVCGMCSICIGLCLACCGFGIWCHFASPSLRASYFSFPRSLVFFCVGLSCSRVHVHRITRDTPISNSFWTLIFNLARDSCVWVYVCRTH